MTNICSCYFTIKISAYHNYIFYCHSSCFDYFLLFFFCVIKSNSRDTCILMPHTQQFIKRHKTQLTTKILYCLILWNIAHTSSYDVYWIPPLLSDHTVDWLTRYHTRDIYISLLTEPNHASPDYFANVSCRQYVCMMMDGQPVVDLCSRLAHVAKK